jgi:hypothetical protein
VDTDKILKSQLDRLENILKKHDTVLVTDKWPGSVRREMNNIGVAQGTDGLPKVHHDKNGKTVSQIHIESYELRLSDLSTRHTSLKADYGSLKSENANLKLEIERLKHGDSVDGEVYEGKVLNVPLFQALSK